MVVSSPQPSYLAKIQAFLFLIVVILFVLLYISDDFEILKKYITDGYKICMLFGGVFLLVIMSYLERMDKALRNCTGFFGCFFSMLLYMIFPINSTK